VAGHDFVHLRGHGCDGVLLQQRDVRVALVARGQQHTRGTKPERELARVGVCCVTLDCMLHRDIPHLSLSVVSLSDETVTYDMCLMAKQRMGA
jgi:hypothetical protein